MAMRLGELVTGGELFNTRKNSVHGCLRLAGLQRPLLLELTGNCAADLAGRHIRFQARGRPTRDEEQELASAGENEGDEECDCRQDGESEKLLLARLNLTGLAWEQIGPTGTITAARKVRVTDCPPAELYARCKLDEPPPMTWKRCLYLEWFSQNGRVVVELVDPVIEVVEAGPSRGVSEQVTPLDPPQDDDSPETGAEDDDSPETGAGGPGITSIELDADGHATIHHETPDLAGFEDSSATGQEQPDAYGLIPDDLQRQLDEQARATDRALHEDPGAPGDEAELIRQMELMDDLIERDAGEPLGALFDGPLSLRPPDQLDEQAAEQELKVLLARLALYGVALHMCEHFTALAAYRLMVERVCQEETAYPELRGTQWVQHFSTADFCPQCQAEFEQEEAV